MQLTEDKRAGRIALDADRLAKFLFERGDDPFGFVRQDERGFAASIVSRFDDAREAEALIAPPGVETVLYAVGRDALMLAVRESEAPDRLRWPLRQVATRSFAADEVACFGDETFGECCNALRELLVRAQRLLPALAAIVAAEA